MGLGLFPTEPPRSSVETTKLAEDLGYAHVWMGDSQLIWREVYVNLGAAGLATSRILPAIVEHGQQSDGSVRLPAIIAERIGIDVISPPEAP